MGLIPSSTFLLTDFISILLNPFVMFSNSRWNIIITDYRHLAVVAYAIRIVGFINPTVYRAQFSVKNYR